MQDWIMTLVAGVTLFAFIWWTALIVLSIKGLLFHRHERSVIRDDEQKQPADSELVDVPPLPKGCLWAVIFVFWPMAIGHVVNEWLTRRASSSTSSCDRPSKE